MHHQFPFASHNHMLHFLCFDWSLNSQISGSRKFLPITWEGTEFYESYLILHEQKSFTTTIAPKMLTYVCCSWKMSLARNYFWETTKRLKGANGQTKRAPEVMDGSVFWGAKGWLILKAAVQNPTHKLTTPQNHHTQTQIKLHAHTSAN